MSPFWRLLTGTDRPRRERRSKAGLRPEMTALEGRQLMAITMGTTVAQGTTLTDGTVLKSNLVLPGVQASPKFLFPSDGRYVPVTISGGITNGYVMNLDGPYAIFPKPTSAAGILAQLPLPDPTSTTAAPVLKPLPPSTYTATLPGSKVPVEVSYTLDAYAPASINPAGPNPDGTPNFPLLSPAVARYTVTLPGYHYPMKIAAVWQGGSVETTTVTVVSKTGKKTEITTFPTVDGHYVVSPAGFYQISVSTLPISDYENSVIDARLNGRRGPADAILQVTDQYRRDEPRAFAPLNLLTKPFISNNGLPIYTHARSTAGKTPAGGGKRASGLSAALESTYAEQIYLPTAVSIVRQYSYSFSTHLQALKHTGTGGRQYIVNVSSEDADDGGSSNTAVIVPGNA